MRKNPFVVHHFLWRVGGVGGCYHRDGFYVGLFGSEESGDTLWDVKSKLRF